MKCTELLEKIDSLSDSYIPIWIEACEIESPTSHKTGVDATGRYFAAIAERHGWDVEYFHQDKSGDVVTITMNPEAEGAPIFLSGHMDTVHAVGQFGYPAVRRDETKLYGPGVTDCKGGIVAALLAMDALAAVGYDRRPVKLILQSDEECGSKLSNKATINYICKSAEGAAAFLNLEGHARGYACLIRKGAVTFTFNVHGVPAHAAACATAGANAIAEAAYKIIEMEKLKDSAGITCNCGTIVGGTVANTVPDSCTFTANIRFANSEQLKIAREYAGRVAAEVHIPGSSCDLVMPEGRVAMEYTERNFDLLTKMNEIYAENGLPILEVGKRVGASDAADITAHGIACIDSIGVTGGKIHSLDEYAEICSLNEAAKRIGAVVYSL